MNNIEDNEDNEDNEELSSIDISGNNIESHIQTIFNDIINNNSIPPFINASRSREAMIRNYLTHDLLHSYPPQMSYDHPNTQLPPTNLNSVLQQSFNEVSSFKNVIDDDELLLLQLVKYKDTDKKNNTCPIICSEFEDDDNVIELPCKHVYTPNAIKKWLKEESNMCPFCRYEFKSKEIKKEADDSLEEENSVSEATNANYFHNPMQRYLIDRIINSVPNRINMPTPIPLPPPSPGFFLFNSNEITEDDNDFQQAIINSMSQSHSDIHSDTDNNDV